MRAVKKRRRGLRTGYDPDSMRILHISTPMIWRGGEQQLVYLFKGLEPYDLQQCILLPKGSALETDSREKGRPFAAFSRKGPLNIMLAWELKRLVKSYTPDIVHVHDAHAHTAAFICELLFRIKVPMIVHRRVDFPVGKHFFSRWKFDHPRVARVIAVSDAIRRIGSEGVKQDGKWVTVHSGIDPERVKERKDPERIRHELGVSPGLPIIGNVAALADHKDHVTFLRTARSFLDKGMKGIFVIIGEGPERSVVEAERESLGLKDQVHLLGFRSDALELMSGFDLFLMSSKTEGLGTSLLDALAASVPVVSTNAGGIPEVLTHEKNALLQDVGDHEALAEASIRLLQEPRTREKLVAEGLKTAEENAYSRMAERVHEIYAATLERPKSE